MNLKLNSLLLETYSSASQGMRVVSEEWVHHQIYCPHCGTNNLYKLPNNQPVADFTCNSCNEIYELKSARTKIGRKIVDGAYGTMMSRLSSKTNPNLFLLVYDCENWFVKDFLVIPKHFFLPATIERRNPLSETARRAGWVGCNIVLDAVPESGRISFVRNGQISSKDGVMAEWQKTLFLRDQESDTTKGWLLDVMKCIDALGKIRFSLDEIYCYENELHNKYPSNSHIKEKIRQQLQVLRDKGYIQFLGRGQYQLV